MKITQLASLTALGFLMMTGCATPVGKAKFPEASANFTPKQSYAVAQDKLWEAVIAALDKNRIATTSMDKGSGVIQTDYIQGESKLYALGLIAGQNTRYKYNLALRNNAEGQTKLNILCKVESTMAGQAGSSPWTDISGHNPDSVRKLEAWLYEEIEKEL